MKKIKKQSIPNAINLLMLVKSKKKGFGFIKPSPGLYDGENSCLNNEAYSYLNNRRKKVYREKHS